MCNVRCVHGWLHQLYVLCAVEDIPSDAEAEARLHHVEEPEPLPVDNGKLGSLEQVSRIGMILC